MKNFSIVILLVLSVLFLSAPSDARPNIEEFRSKDYDYSAIKTVLVMPVSCDITIPQSEAFFNETVQQVWKEMTSTEKFGGNFLMKSPEQIVERNNFVKGTAQDKAASADVVLKSAMSLAPEYTDAVMTMSVTKCAYETKNHPEEITWETRYEERPVIVNGKWEMAKVPIKYQKVKPAWDEKYASGAVRLEFRGSKDRKLIYGVTATSDAYGDYFSSVPTLTKHISNLIEAAAKRIPKK